MASEAPSLSRPSPLIESAPTRRGMSPGRAVLLGGLAVGICDITDALVFFGLAYGATPLRIFQSVAAGLLGREAARAGGIPTAILGGFLHFFIATSIALVYYLVSRRMKVLTERPVLCGLGYGVICYFVMSFVVLPLSRTARGLHWPEWPIFFNGIIGHALLVGLPAALVISRFAPYEPARGTGRSARE